MPEGRCGEGDNHASLRHIIAMMDLPLMSNFDEDYDYDYGNDYDNDYNNARHHILFDGVRIGEGEGNNVPKNGHRWYGASSKGRERWVIDDEVYRKVVGIFPGGKDLLLLLLLL